MDPIKIPKGYWHCSNCDTEVPDDQVINDDMHMVCGHQLDMCLIEEVPVMAIPELALEIPMQEHFKVGDKVRFNYYDHETDKEVFGVGRLTEIDIERGNYYIQTTRKLHWMEIQEDNINIKLWKK